MNVIKYKWVFLGFSGLMLAASIFGVTVFGLEKGIDFTGGTLWQIQFDATAQASSTTTMAVSQPALLAELVTAGEKDAIVAEQGLPGAFIIKTKEMDESRHQYYAVALKTKFGSFTELSFESIGSVIGAELTRKAMAALVTNLVAISLYVAYAFRKVSYPVSSWKYALITMATLFHDAMIPIGLFAFLGHFAGVEIDLNFIVAILVVVGFSVHDTIVVFDRVRENLRTGKAGEEFAALVNRSVNETFTRSLNTSLTLIIVLVILFMFGALTLKYFILAMLVGTVFGTYSSIFVASPLLVLWQSTASKK